METFRKWFYRPKVYFSLGAHCGHGTVKDDQSLLAQFFFADEALNIIANELDSFDGRKDPVRCTSLVNQLRQCQDRVLTVTFAIMDVLIGDERANRDFRVKFPEDVLQENLAGQLWFGAECLAAGSSIMNRETESAEMRPLAKALTKSLDNVRNLLREACLRSNTPNGPLKLNSNEIVTEMLVESLKIFDRLFAEFELCYVSAMVPVKSTQEYELQELIGVLFSETLQRALKMNLLTQEMVDDYDPALMFTIPRLAIVSGLLVFPNGPLCIDKSIEEMSEMFRPFRTLLLKIRELLWTLNKRELFMVEKLLCDNEQISDLKSVSEINGVNTDLDDFVSKFYNDYPCCKDYVSNLYTVSGDLVVDLSNQDVDNKLGVVVNAVESPSKILDLTRSSSMEIPSTSGYRITNTVGYDQMVASMSDRAEIQPRVDSLPDHDHLEVISVAAATLSSILTKEVAKTNEVQPKSDLESPNDSGICTETTSLDRSPSLDLNDAKGCSCVKNETILKVNHCKCGKTKQISLSYTENGNIENKCTYSTTVEKSDFPCSSKAFLQNRKFGKGIRSPQKIVDDETLSTASSDTSSFNSNTADDEEIALAIQAAEIANRNEIRSKFRSSEDLVHRLFVCIAGVADQLQTNFASDLRIILKSVFLINASSSSESLHSSMEYHPSESEVIENNEFAVDPNILAQEALFDSNIYFQMDENADHSSQPGYSNHPVAEVVNRVSDLSLPSSNSRTNMDNMPPAWIPDIEAPKCMSCGSNFTVVKRRHHCRNCGKVFCARCSSNSVPLPKFGLIKPVRVCNKCFMYQLTPFTM